MRHFPIFLALHDRRALVLGTGPIADRKAALLEQAGATVERLEHFNPVRLTGCALAIGAEAPEADLRDLFDAGRRLGVPVNVVDRPELCTFVSPAIIDRDPLTIAVASGGVAPVLSRLVRARIEAVIAPGWSRLAALAERLRAETVRRLPDMASRRRMLEQALSGRAAELALAGDEVAAETEYRRELRDAEAGVAERRGMVFLVGAGPGAADLVTLRAQRLLGEADIIVHDRLVSDEVLGLARRDAEFIYVGKSRGNHCLPQAEINALLIHLAQAGRKVVRLKGGDPFVFGRGGEEIEALREAGIACQVVPGVTAALACAAQAGIPLTHRDAARLVTFVTGHAKDGVPELDYAALVRSAATLAIYMGLANLPALRDALLANGLDAAMPAALIERGGTPLQRVARGTLDELVVLAPSWSTSGPTLVLVGAAVGRAKVESGVAARELVSAS